MKIAVATLGNFHAGGRFVLKENEMTDKELQKAMDSSVSFEDPVNVWK